MSTPNTTTETLVSLNDMPDLPLKHILSYVGFRSLQSLRLVSKPLRHFIDTEKPPVQIDDLEIKENQHGVELELSSCGLVSHLEVDKNGEGTVVSSGDKRRYYEGTDYLDFSLGLIKYVLNTQTPHTIKKLGYSGGKDSKLLEIFQKFLTVQKIILKFREFYFRGYEHRAVQFLSFLDSNILKDLIFNFTEYTSDDHLMKMEQWKKAKSLLSTHKTFRVPIQNFSHFVSAEFNMYNITAQDLIYLKEKYTQSSIFAEATIHFWRLASPPAEVFGSQLKRTSGGSNVPILITLWFLFFVLEQSVVFVQCFFECSCI